MIGPAKLRIITTRIVAVPLVLIQLFTEFPHHEGFLDLTIQICAFVLIGISMMGRAYCSLFIEGNKSHSLIMVGPYSTVRNPLYFFSFIAAIGTGLCSENIIFFILVTFAFTIYYSRAIIREERKLIQIHGKLYTDYLNNVPRFFPKLSSYSCPNNYTFETRRVTKAFRDCLAFLLIFPFFEAIEYLHSSGYVPVFLSINLDLFGYVTERFLPHI